MNEYKSFADRVLTIMPDVIGYRLLPFSLGMSQILKASNSKFITGEYNSFLDINHIAQALITDNSVISEFVYAVLVCSTTPDDFLKECSNGELRQAVTDTAERIKGVNLLTEIHTFAHYLKDGTSAPLYDIVKGDNDSDIDTNPIDSEQAIMSVLMSECGYTRDECLNLPMTETLSAYLLYAHKMGSIKLVSKEVFDLKQKIKGMK